jgi:DNA-binding winged helix-turn-helix (wHTH) protein
VGTEPHRFFPPFRVDSKNAQLWRGDQEIRLRRKTFDVLLYLIDHPGQLVTKAALLDAIRADVTVSDSMPATYVAELRKALGDEARVPRFIETVHGRGYRFIAEVKTPASVAPISKAPSVPKSPRPIVVGRQDELAQLQSWYSRVLEGQRQVIFVTGEAGIGKTTFGFFQISDPRRPVDARLHPAETKIEFGALFFAPDAAFQKLDSSCPMPGGFFISEDN